MIFQFNKCKGLIDMLDKNVYIFWQGPEPPLITLLRRIMMMHSNDGNAFKVNLINLESLDKYIKHIPDYFHNLKVEHKADFIRVNILCEYGGLWLDSDTLVMDNLQSLFKICNQKDGFFILENNKALCNGVFGTRANTELMKVWRDQIHSLLSNNTNIEWSDIGSSMLIKLKKESPSLFKNYKIFKGLNNMYPVNWDNCVEEFINKPYNNYKNILRPYQPLIVLVGAVYRKLSDYSEKEIINANIPLSYFIRKSLNISSRYKKTRKNKSKK